MCDPVRCSRPRDMLLPRPCASSTANMPQTQGVKLAKMLRKARDLVCAVALDLGPVSASEYRAFEQVQGDILAMHAHASKFIYVQRASAKSRSRQEKLVRNDKDGPTPPPVEESVAESPVQNESPGPATPAPADATVSGEEESRLIGGEDALPPTASSSAIVSKVRI